MTIRSESYIVIDEIRSPESIIGINFGPSKEIVLTTWNGVFCYALKSQPKLLCSWQSETKESRFNNSVVWDPFSLQYFGAVISKNEKHELVSFRKCVTASNTVALNFLKRSTTEYPVHSVLPLCGPLQPSLLALDHCKLSHEELSTLGGFLVVSRNGDLLSYSSNFEEISSNSFHHLSDATSVEAIAMSKSKIRFKSSQIQFNSFDSEPSEFSWVLAVAVSKRVDKSKRLESKARGSQVKPDGKNSKFDSQRQVKLKNRDDRKNRPIEIHLIDGASGSGSDLVSGLASVTGKNATKVGKPSLKHYLRLYCITVSKIQEKKTEESPEKNFAVRFVGSVFLNNEFGLQSDLVRISGLSCSDHGSISVLWSNNTFQSFSFTTQLLANPAIPKIVLSLKPRNKGLKLAYINIDASESNSRAKFNDEVDGDGRSGDDEKISKKRSLSAIVKKKNGYSSFIGMKNFSMHSIPGDDYVALVCKANGSPSKSNQSKGLNSNKQNRSDTITGIGSSADEKLHENEGDEMNLVILDSKYGSIHSVSPLSFSKDPLKRSNESNRSNGLKKVKHVSELPVTSFFIGGDKNVLLISNGRSVSITTADLQKLTLSSVIGSMQTCSVYDTLNKHSNLKLGWTVLNSNSAEASAKILTPEFYADMQNPPVAESFYPWWRFAKPGNNNHAVKKEGFDASAERMSDDVSGIGDIVVDKYRVLFHNNHFQKVQRANSRISNFLHKDNHPSMAEIVQQLLDYGRVYFPGKDLSSSKRNKDRNIYNLFRTCEGAAEVSIAVNQNMNPIINGDSDTAATISAATTAVTPAFIPHLSGDNDGDNPGVNGDSNVGSDPDVNGNGNDNDNDNDDGKRNGASAVDDFNVEPAVTTDTTEKPSAKTPAKLGTDQILKLDYIIRNMPSCFTTLLFKKCFSLQYFSFCKWIIQSQNLTLFDFPDLPNLVMGRSNLDLLECCFRYLAAVPPSFITQSLTFCLIPSKQNSSLQHLMLLRKAHVQSLIQEIKIRSDARKGGDVDMLEASSLKVQEVGWTVLYFDFQEFSFEDLLKSAVIADCAIRGFTALEICLHSLVGSDQDHSVISAALSDLSSEAILGLLRYLIKWMQHYVLRIDAAAMLKPKSESLSETKSRFPIPTYAKVIAWLSILIDLHFPRLVMLPECAEALQNLSSLISSFVQSSKEQACIYAILQNMVSSH